MNNKFTKILISLDNDEELFSKIALPVAERYLSTADLAESLVKEMNFPELSRTMHKLKATWPLYIDINNTLPEEIEKCIEEKDYNAAKNLTNDVINLLRITSKELEMWVKNYHRKSG